jgi:phosphate transport system permease protein
MGFAVIPTIFSIAEDAVFSVPKSLTFGSLALGATPWQTLTRVVILTASPGIFSAVMIGMGRAVGETMIVLMATGNTAIMDMNIFEGLRTLAANVAVEMPESEVGGTHYRVLFLSALVLLGFTFVMNTLAELVRQRLRVKYASL